MKLGFVSMPPSGHLNPMTALAGRLQSLGHALVSLAQGCRLSRFRLGTTSRALLQRIADHGVREFVAVEPAARNVA